jgi:hypothetical protein
VCLCVVVVGGGGGGGEFEQKPALWGGPEHFWGVTNNPPPPAPPPSRPVGGEAQRPAEREQPVLPAAEAPAARALRPPPQHPPGGAGSWLDGGRECVCACWVGGWVLIVRCSLCPPPTHTHHHRFTRGTRQVYGLKILRDLEGGKPIEECLGGFKPDEAAMALMSREGDKHPFIAAVEDML